MVLNPSYSYPGKQDETSGSGVALLLIFLFTFNECQHVFGRALSIFNLVPDFMLATAVACGVFRGREQGFWLGFFCGLLQDLASAPGTSFGQLSLAKMLIAWSVGCLSSSVSKTFVLVPFVLIGLATVVNGVIVALFSSSLSELTFYSVSKAIFVNLLYGIPLYYLVGILPGRRST